MTDERPLGDHIDSETLAAFIEGKVSTTERVAIEAHLAGCEECCEVWMGALDGPGDSGRVARETRPMPRQWVRLAVAASLVLIAATAVWWQSRSPSVDDDLVVVLHATTGRVSDGQLSAPLPWRPRPSVNRGGESIDMTLSGQAAAVRLLQLAAQSDTVRHLHAAALVHLAQGRVDASVDLLERASSRASADWRLFVDLSAALLERYRIHGRIIDAAASLSAAESALALDAENLSALFNKAVAAEATGNVDLAVATWTNYLRRAPAGEWRAEAEQRLAQLVPSHKQSDRRPATTEWDVIDGPLRRWATPEGSQSDADEVRRASLELRSTTLHTFAAAIDQSRSWSQRRQKCLRQAALTLSTWQAAFSRVGSAAASRLVDELAVSAECAGLRPSVVTIPRAWADIYAGRSAQAAMGGTAALRVATNSNDNGLRAQALEVLGAAATDLGQISDAVRLRTDALTALGSRRDDRLMGRVSVLLGELSAEHGDLAGAWEHFGRALRTVAYVQDAGWRYTVLSATVIAANHNKLHGLALALSPQLAESAERTGRVPAQAMASLQRGRALIGLHLIADGTAAIDHGHDLIDRMPMGTLRDAWRAEAGWVRGQSLSDRSPQAAIESLTIPIDYFTKIGRQFRLAELLWHRGRAHHAAGSTINATTDWLKAASVIEDQRAGVREEQLRVSRTAAIWGLFSDLIALHHNHPETSLVIAERARARELLDYLPPSGESRNGSFDELRQCLAPVTALSYAVLPDRLVIWHVSNGVPQSHHRQISRAELHTMVQQLAAELRSDQPPDIATRLAQLLLPESVTFGVDVPLVIVPDGPLHAVPFAALMVGGQRVVERATTILSPSLTSFCRGATPPLGRPKHVLVVGAGAAVPERGLPALPMVEAETQIVASIHPSATVLRGEDATKHRVLDAIEHHDLVHVAAHARVDPALPSRSELFLWSTAPGPSALLPREVSARRMRPGSGVILAACDSAAGLAFTGEGPLSMARAFLAAGARAVVGSLWNISDRDATVIVERVHRLAREGRSLDRALADTQRELIRKSIPASRWSAYVAIGSASR